MPRARSIPLARVSLFVLLASSALLAPPARADCPNWPQLVHGGLALRWDQCAADAGLASRSFACDTNSGSEALVLSYVLNAPMASINGAEFYVDVASSSGAWPSWWQAGAKGTCRSTSFSMSPQAAPAAVACPSPWGPPAVGALTMNAGYNGAATAQIRGAVAVPGGSEISVPAGVETFCVRILIHHARTVGGCAGCATPMCLALSEIKLTSVLGEVRELCGPAFGTDSHLASWQNGVIASSSTHWIPGDAFYWLTTDMVCAAATPSRRAVWGSVKALYR